MCLLPLALFRASSGVAVFLAKDKPGGVIDEQRKCIGGTTPRCSTRLLVEPIELDLPSRRNGPSARVAHYTMHQDETRGPQTLSRCAE